VVGGEEEEHEEAREGHRREESGEPRIGSPRLGGDEDEGDAREDLSVEWHRGAAFLGRGRRSVHATQTIRAGEATLTFADEPMSAFRIRRAYQNRQDTRHRRRAAARAMFEKTLAAGYAVGVAIDGVAGSAGSARSRDVLLDLLMPGWTGSPCSGDEGRLAPPPSRSS
jgi:hypothetical protein